MEYKIKKLKFSSHLIKPILSGEKVSTWRFWDDKDLSVGDKVDFLESGTERIFARVELTKVIEKPLGELSEEDKMGDENFISPEAMYATFSEYYKRSVTASTVVKIIWFELISP